MDEEYSESVDTSADMDVSDVDVSDDVPADIPDDIPEDVPEDDYSDADISDDVSEDVSEEPADDDIEYDETDESIEEDSIEPESEELDESIDDIEEDSLEESEDTTEDYEELNDIPEDTNGFDEEQTEEVVDDTEEIPEDTDDYEVTDQEEAIEEDIPEDVTDAETADETSDAEDTDTTEHPEDVTDTETADETSDAEDTDTEDQPEDVTDTETADETSDAGDTDTAEQPEDVTDTEAADEAADVENADTTDQPEDVTDTETTDETSDVADTDTEDQPEDVTGTEAADEIADAEDTATAEQSENQSDLETYDYETSPETQDAVNPETSGEFVSAENPYREKWEKFGEEFSDDSETDGWASLKDVPFSGDEQEDTGSCTEGTDVDDSATSYETTDVDNSPETSEINSISDYMNAHNYGPDDFATYSQDPQWRQLMRQEYPDYELPEMTRESANAQLSQYMNDHNYGVDDYAKYSQDPIWRELHSTAFPDDELPPLRDGGLDDTPADADGSLLSKFFRKDAKDATDSGSQQSQIKDIVGEDEYKKYQGFYDSLEKLGVSQDYREKITDCYRKLDSDIKDVYNGLSAKLQCLDTQHQGTAYFSPDEGGFRFNESADISKGLGAGNTFFHESAHMIDWLAGKGGTNITQLNNLTDAAQADYNDAISSIMGRENCTMEKAQSILSDELWNNPNESNCVSDIFGGLSGNKVSGAWGHRTEYWATRDRSIIGKEAFAEITADSACNGRNLAFTQKYMPRTCSAYRAIMKSIKGGIQV